VNGGQLSLGNLSEGPAPAKRDEAVTRVERGTDPQWMENALGVVKALAARGVPFTTDEVWATVGDWTTTEPRALGAVMRRAQREGFARPTAGYRPSVRPECNARPVRVWEGVPS
jgi:hypothetical protein